MTLFPSDEEAPDVPVRGRCRECHRPLYDPRWIALGWGEDCATKLGLLPASSPRVRLGGVRAGGDVAGQGNLLDEGEET